MPGSGEGGCTATFGAVLDELVAHCAAPDLVQVGLQRLAEAQPDSRGRLDRDADLARAVVAVMAASRSMTNLVVSDSLAVDQLADLEHRAPIHAGTGEALAAWKRREYMRIAARDLLGIDRLEATGQTLSDMAADVLHGAVLVTHSVDLAVVGMGKLAAGELNYASDVDIVFVTDGNLEGAAEAARAVIDVAGRCFRIDTNLRPEGNAGALVRTLESYQAYWDRWAEAWEFQALLKARPVAGVEALGNAWAAAAGERLWRRQFSAQDLRQIREIKAKGEAHIGSRGLLDREVKRGHGGIRDVEFTVQLLQLVHGRHDELLRVPNTLEALAALAEGGYVAADDAEALTSGYRFLRATEHALQLVQERQTHVVPADEAARERLARVLGFAATPRRSPLEAFDAELTATQARVRAIHERIYFRPLLEAFSAPDLQPTALTDEAVRDRLVAYGFINPDRAVRALDELTRGLGRGARVMQQLLPLMLSWLAETPDPDLGLLNLRFHTEGVTRSRMLTQRLRDNLEVGHRLCIVLGSSRMVSDQLLGSPDVGAELAELPARLDMDLGAAARAALAGATDVDEARRRLRRLRDLAVARISAADLCELIAVDEVGIRLGQVADAVVTAALEVVDPPLPFVVVAMGRYGGSDLSYASDLDLVFAYEGGTPDDQQQAERAARALRDLVGQTGPHQVYEIDLDLRPEGRKGRLARSLNGWHTYFEHWAEPWERLAMTRARVVVGDPAAARGFVLATAPMVWATAPDEAAVGVIRHVKGRIDKEKRPADVEHWQSLKFGPGGLVDIEFATQLTQLRTGARGQRTLAALDNLVARGYLSASDAATMAAAYRSALRLRNRLFLLGSRRPDVLPDAGPDLDRLARSLHVTPANLIDEHRSAAAAARAVVERLFSAEDEFADPPIGRGAVRP